MPGARVLDLFAGSGALGIEALSRGAAEATFVEYHAQTTAVIRRNLKVTGLDKWMRFVFLISTPPRKAST